MSENPEQGSTGRQLLESKKEGSFQSLGMATGLEHLAGLSVKELLADGNSFHTMTSGGTEASQPGR